jgi:hypothetical protein
MADTLVSPPTPVPAPAPAPAAATAAGPAPAPAPAPATSGAAPAKGPVVGLNIRKEANSKSAILGILPKDALIEVGATSADGKWAPITKVVEGQIEPARKDGKVDPAAATGWVFLAELDKEGGEPETFDAVYCLPKPYRIAAGEMVGHVGEYQRYREATPLPPVAKRPLLHMEVFAGTDFPAFLAKSRARDAQLPASAKTLLVIAKGAKMVPQPAKPDQTLATGARLKAATGSPANGRWAKATVLEPKLMERSALGAYNAKKKTYAGGQVFTGRYAGASDTDVISEAQFTGLSRTAQQPYSRREVLVAAAGDPIWVERGQLNSTTGGQATWKKFPLSIADASSAPAGVALVQSRTSLDALGALKIAVDDKGVHWWQVTLGAEGGATATGWVCEKDHPNTQWQSPWAWPGFEIADASSISVVDSFKRFLSVVGTTQGAEAQQFQPTALTVNGSAFITKLEQAVDVQGNKDGTVTAAELQHAMKLPWLAQGMSRMIVRYESEWGGDMSRWDAVTQLMKDRSFVWQAELQRIKKLQWWDGAKGVNAFPGDTKVFHLHPIGLIGNFAGFSSSLDELIRKIGDIIAGGEGSYESYNSGTKGVVGGGVGHSFANPAAGTVTNKTINQIIATDALSGNDASRLFATGKYQTVIATLTAAKDKMSLTGDEKYDAAMQERVFREYLIDKAGSGTLAAFVKKGKGTVDDAQLAAAKEWASIAAPNGATIKNGSVSDGTSSYYESSANHANQSSSKKLRDILVEIAQSRGSGTQ